MLNCVLKGFALRQIVAKIKIVLVVKFAVITDVLVAPLVVIVLLAISALLDNVYWGIVPNEQTVPRA